MVESWRRAGALRLDMSSKILPYRCHPALTDLVFSAENSVRFTAHVLTKQGSQHSQRRSWWYFPSHADHCLLESYLKTVSNLVQILLYLETAADVLHVIEDRDTRKRVIKLGGLNCCLTIHHTAHVALSHVGPTGGAGIKCRFSEQSLFLSRQVSGRV